MDNQRINIWERKLLDLTMGNALINTKYGANCMQTVEQDERSIVAHLLNSEHLALLPAENPAAGLHFPLNKESLQKAAHKFLNKACENLEETGSEQLFLGFGMMRWVENPDPLHPGKACKEHIAPVALMPVGILQVKVTGEHYLFPRAEEVIPNITLIELLKQDHERDLTELVPKDGINVGLDTILSTFGKCAESKADKGWSMSDEICLGFFSFAKFVMWNDIHTNSAEMRKVPMVESLIQKRVHDSIPVPAADARELDKSMSPDDHIFPIDADSSQVEAVVDAAHGKSFLLYGPPGTGKSQTITNMIANSLYHGQSVLFVAQKRAALEVVQERLTQIGLDPFFIELHSNKVTKTHLINQLSYALAQAEDPGDGVFFEDEARLLMARRQELLVYTEAVHGKQQIGGDQVSLADCIETCLTENAPYELLLPKKVLLSINKARMEEVEKLFREMVQLRADMQREQGELAPWLMDVKNFFHFRLGMSNVTPYRFRYQWQKREKQLAAWKVSSLLPILENEGVERLMQYLRYEVAHARAMHLIEQDETLLLFHSESFNDIVADYRKKAEDFKEVSRKYLLSVMRCELRKLLHSNDPATQTSLIEIRRWIKNRGRNVSIRTLMQLHGNTIHRLCPCMLMSPMSVAQYLPIENEPFNLVLFDEASQIPTAESIGAIARANAAIIVGDPKQMPSTTSLQREINTVDDVEHNDMESILDDCITLGMPEHYLNYHYRSRHESLIAFANHYYYANRLITFPSVDDRENHIHYKHVRGVYDYSKSRTNRMEAEAIVSEVIRRLSDPVLNEQSMGVIAFSTVQQNLIDELLQERIGRNKELMAKAYGDDVAEPLFIKNLENVQGDERDVILFSVCYGPAENGKISMNFGPLNNAGGERRLNVAVTRARQEMVVFSSMTSADIDLEKSNALGVQGLKNFLYYAENGTLPEEPEIARMEIVNPLAEHLAADLRKAGYQVDTNVGKSDFRVDVAVLDIKHPGTYKLGILFDGRGYYRIPMTRDRELVQPMVLEHLGWNLAKVWQEEYFRHPEDVTRTIVELLKKEHLYSQK